MFRRSANPSRQKCGRNEVFHEACFLPSSAVSYCTLCCYVVRPSQNKTAIRRSSVLRCIPHSNVGLAAPSSPARMLPNGYILRALSLTSRPHRHSPDIANTVRWSCLPMATTRRYRLLSILKIVTDDILVVDQGRCLHS